MSPTLMPHWSDMLSVEALAAIADAAVAGLGGETGPGDVTASIGRAESNVPLALWFGSPHEPKAPGEFQWVTPCLSWSAEPSRMSEAESHCAGLARRAVARVTQKSTVGPRGQWTVSALPLSRPEHEGPQAAVIVLRPRPAADMGDPASPVANQWTASLQQSASVTASLDEWAQAIVAQRDAERLMTRVAAPRHGSKRHPRPQVASSDTQRELLNSLNHEVRAPLATLQGVAATLREDTEMGAVDRADFLEVMERESRRVAVLVDDLLLLTRLETIADPPVVASVDLRLCVSEVVGELLSDFEAAGVALRVPPPFKPILAKTHLPLFHSLIRCLLGHSLKFTHSGGAVELDWLAIDGPEPQWAMVVQDDGIQLPAAELADAFDVFYGSRRAARTTAAAGLGLVLAKRIARAQGWGIDITAATGTGTRITVYIPQETGAV